MIPAVRYACSRRIAAATLCLAITLPLAAETLADAVEAAYARNPALVQQRYIQQGRDESYVQARAQYGPQLSVQVEGDQNYYKVGDTAGISSRGGRAVATLSQPLYTSGRIRGQVAAARANVRGGQEDVRQVEQQTLQNVVTVYAAVLRDQARLEVGRENVDVLRGQLVQNRERQKRGDVTLTDVAQADARLAAAEQQFAILESDLAVSRGQYVQVVGHPAGALEPLPQLPTLPGSIDVAFDQAEASNPQLLGAQYTEAASSANVAAARGAQGPTVSLNAQGIYSKTLPYYANSVDQKQVVAGLTLSQNILAGGAIRSRVRQAQAQNNADQAGIDLARRQVLQAVNTAWNQLSASRTSLVAGERQVDSAQQAFAGMSCEELNGLRSTIDTLNAEQELQSAQQNLLQNRYQVYISHAALLAAMGRLSADGIAANIKRYDPDANFQRVRYKGVTPLDYLAMGADRILSASPRRKLSPTLTGKDIPRPERSRALPAPPGPELPPAPLVPITSSALRLPDGSTARCPLSVPARNR